MKRLNVQILEQCRQLPQRLLAKQETSHVEMFARKNLDKWYDINQHSLGMVNLFLIADLLLLISSL